VKRTVVNALAILLLLTIFVLPAVAQAPTLPHAFFGSLTVDGKPAPAGTLVEATGQGVRTGIAGNPTTTTQPGAYGGEGAGAPKLIVQGDIAEGATLTFLVNGVPAKQTAEWRSGEVTRLDLTVTTGPSGARPVWLWLLVALAALLVIAAPVVYFVRRRPAGAR